MFTENGEDIEQRPMRCKSCGRVAGWIDKNGFCSSPKCMNGGVENGTTSN
jgi:hypothetical protein